MRLGLQSRRPKDAGYPPEVFNWRLWLLCLVASGGGIIFGYDLAFVSGCFSLPSFLRRFQLNSVTAGHLQTNILAVFQGGAFFGAIITFWFNEKFGRRVALTIAGVLFDIGVILQIACHGNIPTFYVGRIFSGLGIGGSTLIVPQYLSENAPAIARGGIIGFFEIGVQVGSITGFWVNFGTNLHLAANNDAQWMVPISLQFVPVTLMVIGLLCLNESPRWLYLRGRTSDAVRSLTWVRNLPASHPFIQAELQDFERQREHEEDITSGKGFMIVLKESFSKQVRFRLFLGCILQIFLNSTGVNAINYFIVSFFQALGFTGTSVKLLASGIFGICKGTIAVITFIFLIDRFGRRKLIFAGTIGCAFSMYYLAAFSSITDSFHSKRPPNAASNSAVAFIYIYGMSYSLGWNIPWIIAAEIYPTRVRSFCMMWTTCFHWLGEFYTSYAVRYMIERITYGVFLFFGTMTVLGGVFVYFFVPETNGKVLEDMDYLFEAKGFARQQMRAFDEWKRAQAMVIEGKEAREGEGSVEGETVIGEKV